ncbi:MAG TPA: hypothetical protein VGN68_04240 [Sphingopyxis sp.]|jgi:hypothetical protein|uniref:hypothetical protein n=1 Tax=Sphingopyxis sp. TaxID=1908224 RepID=UPI002E14B8AE|nr:hypothetical protein [Sphingopyxis sp.]
MPSLIAMRAKAALLAISEALDESGMVEGARQAAEIDGSEAATQASRTFFDVIIWLEEQVPE